jgi:hypothetical protein
MIKLTMIFLVFAARNASGNRNARAVGNVATVKHPNISLQVVARFGIHLARRASVQVVTTSGSLLPARRAISGQSTKTGMSEKYSTNFCQQ